MAAKVFLALFAIATIARAGVPRADSDPLQYVTVWSDRNGTYVARIALDGTPIDRAALLVARKSYAPVIAFDGNEHLIVYVGEHQTVVGRFFKSDGTFDGEPFRIGKGEIYIAGVKVAWLSDEYLVAWEGTQCGAALVKRDRSTKVLPLFDDRETIFRDIAVGGRLIAYATYDEVFTVRTALISGDEVAAHSVVATPAGASVVALAAAPAPWGFLLTWTELRGDPTRWTPHAARLDKRGAPIGTPFVFPATVDSQDPAISPYLDGEKAHVIVRASGLLEDAIITESGIEARHSLATLPADRHANDVTPLPRRGGPLAVAYDFWESDGTVTTLRVFQ